MSTCFVVMGFGEKTDFQSVPQRVLNLNRTYEDIIKPVVIEAGLACVRADEIIHSTVIDQPMYKQLLNADVVIADLSTSDTNVLYELGVRHGLRARTTIVMAEKSFSFPFDMNHLNILRYEHLGKEISFVEVMRVRGLLKNKIASVMASGEEADSPVFISLPSMVRTLARAKSDDPIPAPNAPPVDSSSFANLLESFHAAKANVKKKMDWINVISLLRRIYLMQPEDPYVIQQLALATYESEQPDVMSSLLEAKKILTRLSPTTSSDAETVSLWGAIHKRLWQVGQRREDLDRSIDAYQRGFCIKDDYHNGIHYAFLLNVRASITDGNEALTDRVLARRARARVLTICDELLRTESFPENDRFWIEVARGEALFGIGRRDDAEAFKELVFVTNPEEWKKETWIRKMADLDKLLPAD
jgi:tetratricopeptide (TPR) repeat protein